jgi:hypothetical protein
MQLNTQHAYLHGKWWAITLLGVVYLLGLSEQTFAPSAHAATQITRTVHFYTSQVHDDCASASGRVTWHTSPIAYRPYIAASGTLIQRRACSGSSYLYLSWDSPSHHNIWIAQVTTRSRISNFTMHQATSLNPGHIALTVCSTRGSWHCGRPFRV